jgi:hypothetical protein
VMGQAQVRLPMRLLGYCLSRKGVGSHN